jgi:hypothetical protein
MNDEGTELGVVQDAGKGALALRIRIERERKEN